MQIYQLQILAFVGSNRIQSVSQTELSMVDVVRQQSYIQSDFTSKPAPALDRW